MRSPAWCLSVFWKPVRVQSYSHSRRLPGAARVQLLLISRVHDGPRSNTKFQRCWYLDDGMSEFPAVPSKTPANNQWCLDVREPNNFVALDPVARISGTNKQQRNFDCCLISGARVPRVVAARKGPASPKSESSFFLRWGNLATEKADSSPAHGQIECCPANLFGQLPGLNAVLVCWVFTLVAQIPTTCDKPAETQKGDPDTPTGWRLRCSWRVFRTATKKLSCPWPTSLSA